MSDCFQMIEGRASQIPLSAVEGEQRVLEEYGKVRLLLNDYIRGTEFKRLINQIIMAQVNNSFRSVAILSEYSREGKTFFAAALALAYAKYLVGRVLIVDTVRQPSNHTLYHRAIRGQYAPDLSHPQTDISPGLIDLLTTGETETAARGTSDFILCSYIDTIKHRYDLVIVDTCAMAEANKDNVDPIIAARHIDTSILITSSRSVERTVVGSIKNRFEQYNINVLGAVFNRGGQS